MTMHADREGANHLLRTAPECLLEAFAAARKDNAGTKGFFREAFDRNADPCLEGRVGRIMEYLQSRSQVPNACRRPPAEDLAVQSLQENASPKAIVGEYLRVFVNECTWRLAKERGVDYEIAKKERQGEASSASAASFARLCNAHSFEASVLAKGLASDLPPRRWEVRLEDGTWSAYGSEQNEVLEMARHLDVPICKIKIRTWIYEVDLDQMVQINAKTWKERSVRCVELGREERSNQPRRARLTHEEIKAAIRYFVDLETLAAAPPARRKEEEEERAQHQPDKAPSMGGLSPYGEQEQKSHQLFDSICSSNSSSIGVAAGNLPGDATGGASP